uniref:Uncharacterized protein n=1 Tax=Mus musculus TaxID=10090 RepID=Q8CAJ2_MOUSE|nr:unnamed protein product [Mus musculus]
MSMSVECLQNRPPLVHFMRELGPWMRCGAAVQDRDRCGPHARGQTGRPGPATEVPLLPNPDGDVSRTWRDTCVFSLSDSTSPVWKTSEDLQIFFSKGILFSCLCNTARILLAPDSPSVFFLTVSPTFWTEDRLCFLVKCWCTLRVF